MDSKMAEPAAAGGSSSTHASSRDAESAGVADASDSKGVELVDIPRAEWLHWTPMTAVLGTYGGGDAMATAAQLYMRRLSPCSEAVARLDKLAPKLRQRIVQAVETSWKAWEAIPEVERIVQLSTARPPVELDKWEWTVGIQFSGRVLEEPYMNVFAQGWLFGPLNLADAGRLGASKWPLVGVFESTGIIRVPSSPLGDMAVGLNALKPADQHVHLVDTDDSWHFGSDMAQLAVQGSLSWGYVVVVDTETTSILVQLLYIFPPALEDSVERLMRSCDDGNDAKALLDGMTPLISKSGHTAALKPLKGLMLGQIEAE